MTLSRDDARLAPEISAELLRLYDELDQVHQMVCNSWAQRNWPGQGNMVPLLGEAVERFTAVMLELSKLARAARRGGQ